MTTEEARSQHVCVGCGGFKLSDMVICWDCFKYRTDCVPLQRFDGTFDDWLAQAKAAKPTVEPLYFVDAACVTPDGGSDGAYDIVDNLPDRASTAEVLAVLGKVLRDGTWGLSQGDKDVEDVALVITVRRAK